MSRRPAVFLDRDGVINRNVFDPVTGEYGAPLTAESFALSPGAIPAIRSLQEAGFLLFLVSNQPNYAKGKSTLEDLTAIHERLKIELDAAGISFTDFFYCYHHPHGIVLEYSGPCECRKPAPFFLLKARDEHELSLKDSWMVGDRVSDIECGRAAGARTIRVQEDHPVERAPGEAKADFEAFDLTEAAKIILRG